MRNVQNRLFLCTFTLAVSAGAVLLLPFSIISNEILLSFPHNYYIQWLNGSLIHGLWNLASLFSNLCLFVLMPFAFFFLESEGFAGLKKGLRARVLETLVVLLLLALLVLGMVWVASALVDQDAASRESLYDLWEFYLPYLYSCVSLMGCLLLLLCTPVGLSRMFAVMGQLLVKPAILEDLDEQMYIVALEEEALQRRLAGLSSSVDYNVMELEQELENVKIFKTKLALWVHAVTSGKCRGRSVPSFHRHWPLSVDCHGDSDTFIQIFNKRGGRRRRLGKEIWCILRSWFSFSLRRPSRSSWWLVISFACWLMKQQCQRERGLRFFGDFIPKKDDTTMTKIIGNCVSLLVLSSALPVMSRTLGLHKLHLSRAPRESDTAKPSANGHQKVL
ncbi:PREDICTED: limb region 1 protein homolog isoform X5 [Myotis davidii]|uniref:limb region 1 protein homolog isoform X5 n=1 Tax=Myotis davidii TaxID=225400 RepID=UPI000766F99F|nr:PREDICTED: limb region 1 protein homolog isoform X5 [Myotis davidii]